MKRHWILAAGLLLLLVGMTSGAIAQQSPGPSQTAPAAPSTPAPSTPSQSPSMQQNPTDPQNDGDTTYGATPWIIGAIVLIAVVAGLIAMGRRREAARRDGREPYTQPRT